MRLGRALLGGDALLFEPFLLLVPGAQHRIGLVESKPDRQRELVGD